MHLILTLRRNNCNSVSLNATVTPGHAKGGEN
jgi:hypothetical protein